MPPEELPDYFRLADVFVMPSTGEGFGIVFLEAMATGVRVIAGNQDGSRDALCDGALGTLVDPENCEELASAIQAALDNPARTGDRTTRFKPELFTGYLHALFQFVSAQKSGSRGRAFIPKEQQRRIISFKSVRLPEKLHSNGSSLTFRYGSMRLHLRETSPG